MTLCYPGKRSKAVGVYDDPGYVDRSCVPVVTLGSADIRESEAHNI